MKASVCMASFNRDPDVLRYVLDSICSQPIPFEYEVIVVDDGSEYGAPMVCREFPVQYHRIERDPTVRSASIARNVGYRAAKGDIIIAQSDDVVHQGKHCVERLCKELESYPSIFVIATVLLCNEHGVPVDVYTGTHGEQSRFVPYFFLGALWRSDLYAIGGDEEEFSTSGGYAHEDKWFAKCLMKGRRLTPLYTKEVTGHHIVHARRANNKQLRINSRLYEKKLAEAQNTGVWCSSGGPWT